MLTVHRNQVPAFESNSAFKPFIVHRFLPGMYAVHPNRKEKLEAEMVKAGIQFGEHTVDYPQGQSLEQEKDLLATQVIEAREHKIALQIWQDQQMSHPMNCALSLKSKQKKKQSKCALQATIAETCANKPWKSIRTFVLSTHRKSEIQNG